jgi:signal transduction histidine kinase
MHALLPLGLLISAGATLLFLPLDLLAGDRRWSFHTSVNLIFVAIYLLAWWRTRRRWSYFVALGLCLVSTAQIFFSIHGHTGPQLGLQMFFLLFAFLPFLLLPRRQWPLMVLLSCFNLLVFVWTHFGLDPSRFPAYEDWIPRIVPILTTLASFLIFIVLVVYFQILAQRREEALLEANRTQDYLFSLVGHDLRGPVGGLKEGLVFLEKNAATMDHAEFQSFLHSLRLTGENVYSLLENLLLWASQAKGRISFHPVAQEWKDLVSQAVFLWQDEAKRRGVDILVEVPPNTVVVCDSEMMSTVLRNLLSNAVKFSPSGSHIIMRSQVVNKRLQCVVVDQGIGMDEATRLSLFDEAKRPRRLGVRGERGTGLGLLLVKEFVKRHGGTVTVESEVGKGTSFTLELPA